MCRSLPLLVPIMLLAAAGCQKATTAPAASRAASPAAGASTELPPRRAGLWLQTLSRDGKPGPMGEMKICVDAATDAKMTTFGREMGKTACRRQQATRDPDGAYRYVSTCGVGHAGTIVSTSVARGDFSRSYALHTESDVSGASFPAMNGHHVTDIKASWAGPCPAGMLPGDMDVGGVKLNINRLPEGGALGSLAPG